MPQQGSCGRFQIVEYNFRWDEINQIVRLIRRGLMAFQVAAGLGIKTRTGTKVFTSRHFFAESVEEIQQKLASIQPVVG